MGSVIEFPSGGSTDVGYLASPAGGSGPGVVRIQEWWGLVGHIKDVCDRFAAEGFVALAPDLYHGTKVAEPGEAAKLMMALELDRAGSDMGGAEIRSLPDEGFVALAPDLYHGTKVAEPGEAAKLMMALELDRAGSDMGGA